MAYTGRYRAGGATFNDQQVGDAFRQALSRANPGFQGLKAGQYFTGADGTRYKTVAGIDPNQPGWGQMVDPDYQLIGYQGGSQANGRARGMGINQNTQGFAILRMNAPKKEEATTPVDTGKGSADPATGTVDVIDEYENQPKGYEDLLASIGDMMKQPDPMQAVGGPGSVLDGGATGFRRKRSSARMAGLTNKGTSSLKITGQTRKSSGLNIG